MKNCLKICLPALLAVFAVRFASGQDEIIINREVQSLGNTKPIPVSIDGFGSEVTEILKFDLYVQGFSFVAPDAAQYQISGTSAGNVVGRVGGPFCQEHHPVALLQRRDDAAAGARVCR